LIELSTGTLFSFPADWRRQILKLVLVLELVLVLVLSIAEKFGSCTNATLFGFRRVSISAEAWGGSEFDEDD
jgi:hypothetical protein